jgi:hypothetical protein
MATGLTEDQAAIVKGLLMRGEKQHDIAAFFAVNGGRIAEVATGQRFADIKPAARGALPTSVELTTDYGVVYARRALERAKTGIEAALSYLANTESEGDAKRAEPKRRRH